MMLSCPGHARQVLMQGTINNYTQWHHLIHFMRDMPRVVSDIYQHFFRNIGNIEKYFTESCSERPE